MTRKLLLTMALALVMALPTAAHHPWQGKKVAYFGDSITDPANAAAKSKYWTYLEQWLDITPYVYAKSGRQWNDIPRQLQLLQDEHGDDVDAIVVLMGTNDYNNGVEPGRWYDEVDTLVYAARGQEKTLQPRKMRLLSYDINTYRGRINNALGMIRKAYPDKQIVLLTPIHRAIFEVNSKNVQPSDIYANKIGEWFDTYVDDIFMAGRLWSVPVIDLNALAGLLPEIEEHGQFFKNPQTDRLHPNDRGHERMAKAIAAQLQVIPVF